MIEDRFKVRENIKKNMPIIIETFVSFYGEENREKITNKFNNLIVCGYLSIDGYSRIYYSERDKISKRAIEEFKKETGIEDSKKLDTIFGFISDFRYIPLIDQANMKLNSQFRIDNYLEFLSKFSGEEIKSLDDPRVEKIKNEINALLPYVERTKERFDKEYDEKLKPFGDYLDKLKKLEESINKKYMTPYLEEIMDLLSEKDKAIIRNGKLFRDFFNMDANHVFIEYSIEPFRKGFLEAFSREEDAILNDESAHDWKKDSIRRDRIEFYKKKGIDLGDDYNAYLNDERCQKITPSYELVERIKNLKNKYKQYAITELCNSMPHISDGIEEIKSNNLLINPNYVKDIVNEITCISVNYANEDGKIVQKPILYFDGKFDEANFDCVLIHELNHLYELNTLSIDGDKVNAICGWDRISETLDPTVKSGDIFEKDEEKRNYEMLNEIMNEFIAQDICTILHQNGITFTTDLENSKNTGGTSYQVILGGFTRTFYELYKDEIIESRKTGDMSKIFDVVGKDNFEQFNDMLRDYSARFQGMDIYKLHRDLHNNVDNEDTRYYHECIDKAKELYSKFKENKAHYEESVGKSR